MKKIIIFLVFSIIFISPINAQVNSNILYGKVFSENHYYKKHHPYFLNNTFYEGSVFYRNKLYNDISLKYDICNQKLIAYQLINKELVNFLELETNYIDSFILITPYEKIKFITSSKLDSISKKGLFYEELYCGKVNFYIEYIKILKDSDGYIKFQLNKNYYLIYKGHVHKIKTKKQLYNIFFQNKKEMRTFKRKNKINLNLRKKHSISDFLSHLELYLLTN